MTEALPLFEHAHFDGKTYDPERDQVRLTGQLQAVYDIVGDGQWRTLAQISALAARQLGKPVSEASASARLRDLRKDRFGGHTIERKSLGGGLFHYRLVV